MPKQIKVELIDEKESNGERIIKKLKSKKSTSHELSNAEEDNSKIVANNETSESSNAELKSSINISKVKKKRSIDAHKRRRQKAKQNKKLKKKLKVVTALAVS
jgi:hypothetical protein